MFIWCECTTIHVSRLVFKSMGFTQQNSCFSLVGSAERKIIAFRLIDEVSVDHSEIHTQINQIKMNAHLEQPPFKIFKKVLSK